MNTKCEKCNRTFDSKESLEQHNNSKHVIHIEKKIQKPKSFKMPLIILAVIGIVAVILYWSNISANSPGKYDTFAKCITEKGAKFYGAFWCPHCNEQKSSFGRSMKYVNYIECSKSDKSGQTPACIEANIESYPTWIFTDGSIKTGKLAFQEISAKTGCSIDGI